MTVLPKTWFTADHHFGHSNILRYTNRPYANINEMDSELIRAWNAAVGQYDVVYHLGDFTLSNVSFAKQIFSLLNGTVYVLRNPWHHDKRWIEDSAECVTRSGSSVLLRDPIEVLEFEDLGIDNYPLPIVLCHYPMAVWDRKHYGSWHLHGHSHGEYKTDGFVLDVGVDSARELIGAYRPFSVDEVARIMLRMRK